MRIFAPHPLPHIAPEHEGFALMAKGLIDRLADVKRTHFERALWVSPCLAPDLGKQIDALTHADLLTVGDIDYFPHQPESYDLIIVNGLLDSVNDLPGALVQIRKALKPDGLFLCAFSGGETLRELRDVLAVAETEIRGGAAPRVHPMVDLITWAALLQRAGFALPVADSEIEVVNYRKLGTLLRDLKSSGGLRLTSRDSRYVGRHFWAQVEDMYRSRFGDTSLGDSGGLLPASFEILYGIGWGPADTQQKPLRPGSAQNRLADALGTTETPLPR